MMQARLFRTQVRCLTLAVGLILGLFALTVQPAAAGSGDSSGAILASVGAWAAQEAPDRGASSSAERVLEVTRPDGRVLIKLFNVSVEGPVQLPVEEAGAAAVQILATVESGQVRVQVAAVDEDLGATPAGTYQLVFNAPAIALSELESFGVAGWSIRYVSVDLTEAGECCSCGSTLSCCPASGKCIGCGICGKCCVIKPAV